MISFEAAIERIRSVAKPLDIETVKLSQAAGRVLAAPVVARIDSPRRDVSSMDGYAARKEDLAALPATLEVAGESFAGAGFNDIVRPGTCVRIFTGAPVPEGANHIVIQENVERRGEVAIIKDYQRDTPYIRKRGSDFAAGDTLLAKGRLLKPRALVAAAGSDHGSVDVFRRPRLRIVSTGDELAEPGTARERADAVPESISLGVAALAEADGAVCFDSIRLSDDLVAIQLAAASACSDADLVVVTGGASVGDRDFAKEMFAPLGLELIFSKVAMKPGKPVWLGRVQNVLILGLPGNPTSALVTARLLMVPLLMMMQGREIDEALQWRSAPLASSLAPCEERETFHRAVMREGRADVLPFTESSAQRTLAEAAILIRQAAASPALETGAIVDVLDF